MSSIDQFSSLCPPLISSFSLSPIDQLLLSLSYWSVSSLCSPLLLFSVLPWLSFPLPHLSFSLYVITLFPPPPCEPFLCCLDFSAQLSFSGRIVLIPPSSLSGENFTISNRAFREQLQRQENRDFFIEDKEILSAGLKEQMTMWQNPSWQLTQG